MLRRHAFDAELVGIESGDDRNAVEEGSRGSRSDLGIFALKLADLEQVPKQPASESYCDLFEVGS